MDYRSIRVGFGYDSHRFVEGRSLYLGGIEIPYERGLLGHSDADVLLHAVGDALLGAVGQGDLGTYFPDSDPAYKDIASTALLSEIRNILKRNGYRVNNVDATVVCEQPHLQRYIPDMRRTIANILEITPDQVGIKATTNEKMGPIGRGEGIASYAVVTVISEAFIA